MEVERRAGVTTTERRREASSRELWQNDIPCFPFPFPSPPRWEEEVRRGSEGERRGKRREEREALF